MAADSRQLTPTRSCSTCAITAPTWAQYKGLTATVTQSLNDKMIKSYGDELGTQSYGAVVDLLVNYYT